MTQEQKELLLKDLCGRLPYGVKVQKYSYEGVETIETLYEIDADGCISTLECETLVPISKPYLFPLSTMTEEQYKEWCDLEANPLDEILTRNANGEKMSTLEHHLLIAKSLTDSVNYCYKNHFDIYGLIPMGLAIDATNKNIY